MHDRNFENLLEMYLSEVDNLEAEGTAPSEERVLGILILRDRIKAILEDVSQYSKGDFAAILELDRRLKSRENIITQAISLDEMRANFNPPKEAWWWFLETPAHSRDRWDWIWSALSIVLLTISLSLVVDISSRFLSGGSDSWAAFAVIAQSVLTMLAAGGTLTKFGRGAFERILRSGNISKLWWQEIRAGFSLALLLVLIVLRLLLPSIAISYNNRGHERYQNGLMASAQYDYARAIKLNPDYPEAHYNLGVLYEDFLDFENAQAEYQIAVKGGLDAAYNNLARLYILNGEFDAAVSLILVGLDLALDDEVRYDMLKNLGWARLGQERYAEAKQRLESAIDIFEDKAPAHCLLAQVFESKSDNEGAQAEWEKCLGLASMFAPDEDAWIHMARNYLGGER